MNYGRYTERNPTTSHASYPQSSMWDFKFSRRRVWCSELSSGIYSLGYHPWWWRQYAPLKRRSTIILHGSISQKTTLNNSLQVETDIVTENEGGRSQKEISVIQGLWQVWPSSVILDLYPDHVIIAWQDNNILQTYMVKWWWSSDMVKWCWLHQKIASKNYWTSYLKLPQHIIWYNSIAKTKVIALKGKELIRAKTMINSNIIEQVTDFS
jgi:hypothetical protein